MNLIAPKAPGHDEKDAAVAGNARLTGATAAVLLPLLCVELATVVMGVKGVLTLHVVIGLLLVPPLLVKIASVSWRFLQYYRRDEAYRRRGAPPPLLRILGPLFLLATLVLFVSGITLLLAPSAFGGPHGTMFYIHDASFYIWLLLGIAHVLAHARDLRRLAGKDWARRTSAAVPGARLRQFALLASLAAGLALALSLVGNVGTFQNAASHVHGQAHQPNATSQAWRAARPATQDTVESLLLMTPVSARARSCACSRSSTVSRPLPRRRAGRGTGAIASGDYANTWCEERSTTAS